MNKKKKKHLYAQSVPYVDCRVCTSILWGQRIRNGEQRKTEKKRNKRPVAAAPTTTKRESSVSILNYIYKCISIYRLHLHIAEKNEKKERRRKKNRLFAIQRITLFVSTAFSNGDWVRSAMFCCRSLSGFGPIHVHRAACETTANFLHAIQANSSE